MAPASSNSALVTQEDWKVARVESTDPPIQMSDGLARNKPGDHSTLAASCIPHARRKYVEVAEAFPEEVAFVLRTLREVFRTDQKAKRNGLSPPERLLLHQQESAPRMQALNDWMTRQFAEHTVEPNSGLGEAISYMQNHWQKLTLFLRVPGAPLDNNICERALKKAILHRKNALFYRTLSLLQNSPAQVAAPQHSPSGSDFCRDRGLGARAANLMASFSLFGANRLLHHGMHGSRRGNVGASLA